MLLELPFPTTVDIVWHDVLLGVTIPYVDSRNLHIQWCIASCVACGVAFRVNNSTYSNSYYNRYISLSAPGIKNATFGFGDSYVGSCNCCDRVQFGIYTDKYACDLTAYKCKLKAVLDFSPQTDVYDLAYNIIP